MTACLVVAVAALFALVLRSEGERDDDPIPTVEGPEDPGRSETPTELSDVRARGHGTGHGRKGNPEAPEVDEALPWTLRIVDASSRRPVAGAVATLDPFGEFDGRRASFRAAEGTNLITVPREALSVPFSVRAARYRMRSLPAPDPPATKGDLERVVELDRTAAIVGTVRDGDSAPLARAPVYLEFFGEGPSLVPEGGEPLPYEGPTLRRTDDDGTYAFSGLPNGEYVTRVEVSGTLRRSTRLRVTAGTWTVSDHWMDQRQRLTVEVTAPDGSPAPRSRAMLLVEGSETPAAAGYTDPDGLVTLGPLAEGTYSLAIISDEGEAKPTQVLVSAGGSSNMSIAIRLTPPERH